MLPSADALAPVLLDLELDPSELGRRAHLCDGADAGERARLLADEEILLVCVPGSDGAPSDAELARIREALWPACHLIGLYRSSGSGLVRRGVAGGARLDATMDWHGAVLAARTRGHVMSPEVTATKFDANASGWNGEPGSAGYGHFRWMRRFVGTFTSIPSGARVLDFGCGAGWVGIEAAKTARDVELCFFDPSPEMVRIAADNAKAAGIAKHEGRVGFGEDPPFPADGEPPFDVVISSGVLSFSPDLDRWIDGLVRAVKKGGSLVVGDLNPTSRGMQRRRRTHPLLPVRELNAQTSDVIRSRLEAAGFRHRTTTGYQLTYPVPQAMFVSEEKLGGVLSPLLLFANMAGASMERALGDPAQSFFDSWVSSYSCARD